MVIHEFKIMLLGFMAYAIYSCSFEKKNNNVELVKTGLAGGLNHSADLIRIDSSVYIEKPDVQWNVISGRGKSLSTQWKGFISAPVSGEVTLIGNNLLLYYKIKVGTAHIRNNYLTSFTEELEV